MSAVTRWIEQHALPADDNESWQADARRLTVRTLVDSFEDRVPGMAAEMAFYIVLSLPPLLLVVLGSVGFVVGGLPEADIMRLEETILSVLSTFLTSDTVRDVLARPVAALLREGRSDVLSLGIVLTLWSASRSTNVLLRTLVVAYDIEDRRPAWKRRVLAVGLTLAGVVVAIVVLPLLVVGPDLARQVLELMGFSPSIGRIWPYLYWSGLLIGALAALTVMYRIAPGWRTRWRRDVAGAVLAVVVWLAASGAIRVYTARFAGFSTDEVFRGLAAPLVLLLWLYASGIAVLLGAELNAEIEKLWPSPEGPYRSRQPPD